MKRTLAALLLAVCILTGCGASTGGNAMTDSAPQENMSMGGAYDKGDYNYGWSDDVVTEEAPSAPESGLTGSDVSNTLPDNSKMIYTADVTLETREFDEANAAIAALVSSVGGYFERNELNQGGTYRSVYCTIRVPASRFAEFLDQAGAVAHMTYCNRYSQNVSEVYYDLEARLTTQRTKLQRLQELLAEAKNMSDIITLESAISDTELQIEYLTGSLRKYDSLIDYSTINLSLREVYRLSNEEVTPVTFGDRLETAFKRGLEQAADNFEDFVIYVARNWLTLLVWAGIIAAAVTVIRRRVRKHRAEKLGGVYTVKQKKSDETEEK